MKSSTIAEVVIAASYAICRQTDVPLTALHMDITESNDLYDYDESERY